MKCAALTALLFLVALPAGAAPVKHKRVPKNPPQMLAVPLAAARTVQVTEILSVASRGPGLGPLGSPMTLTIVAERPNRFHLQLTSDKAPSNLLLSDGKTVIIYDGARKEYRNQDAPAGKWPGPLAELMNLPATMPVMPAKLDGVSRLLFVQVAGYGTAFSTSKVWLDAQTSLPVRQSVYTAKAGKMQEVMRVDFSHWVLNQPVPAAQFAFTPPADAKEYVEPPAPVLLANGTIAPDFTVQDKDGKPVKLSDYKGKVVVLDFWATWCGPCQQSLPHTQAVAKQFAAQGVTVLAVNVSDSKDAFLKWLPQHPEYSAIAFAIDTSPPGKDVAATLYGVDGIPTQYVIGKDGKVVTHFVGYEGPTDVLANAVTLALKG